MPCDLPNGGGNLRYLGGGAAFVAAGTLVDSAGPRLGGAPVVIVNGIADVPEIVPGVLEGGRVAGVPAGGTAAGEVWGAFPKLLSNVLLRRL